MNKFYINEKDIETWLDKYKIQNYKLVPDEKYGYVVNVKGNVYLVGNNLSYIPVKFNHVEESFNCSRNQLNSLEFCPQTIGGNFNCNDNQLTSLEFCPQTIGRNFSCSNNQLTSLKFCPETVGGDFSCSYNELASLEFCPQSVGDFSCSSNKLTSLEFCPQSVGGDFWCYDNPHLGELQNIEDFSLIYQEHLRIKEKKDLAQKLIEELPEQIVKNNRIKI